MLKALMLLNTLYVMRLRQNALEIPMNDLAA
jgi:hypothetical protein